MPTSPASEAMLTIAPRLSASASRAYLVQRKAPVRLICINRSQSAAGGAPAAPRPFPPPGECVGEIGGGARWGGTRAARRQADAARAAGDNDDLAVEAV